MSPLSDTAQVHFGGTTLDTSKLSGIEQQLIGAYHTKRKELNQKIEKISQETLDDKQKGTYKERVKNLTNSGFLVEKNGKPLIYNFGGRTIVGVRTENGGSIPFYRSRYGIGDKTPGNWYPCFGISGNDSWIIKGTLKGLSSAHGVRELKKIQSTLNESFDWNTDYDQYLIWNKQRHPLFQA